MECTSSWLCITSFLDTRSLVAWIATCRLHRAWFASQMKRWRELQAGIAMSRYIRHHVRVQVEVHSQNAQTQSIPRSDDPRVPPRVETVWIEHGAIAAESMTLPAVQTASMHHPQRDLISLHVDCRPMTPPPMLVHTVHGSKCLYSVVRVLVASSSSVDGLRELHRYVYHKHQGDLAVVSVTDKRKWSTQGASPFRFDVLSIDGSCQMELNVPAHLDAMVDCYHIHHVGVLLQKSQLFPLPLRALASPPPTIHCHLTFYDLHQNLVSGRLRGTGSIVEEVAAPSNPPARPSNMGTVVELLQVFTASIEFPSLATPASDLRSALASPGVVCLAVSTSNPRQRVVQTVALHPGVSSPSAPLVVSWVPGVLEFALWPQTLTRRSLKGSMALSFDLTTGAPVNLRLVFQYLEPMRRTRFAVAWRSASGLA